MPESVVSDAGVGGEADDGEALRGGDLGGNSIDIFVGPDSGPEPGPSHVWSLETCLYF